jgi:riboflavin kinase/FMN adenylyltransferase
MLVHFGVDLIAAEWPESIVCIGTFDGVHRGHQALIQTAVDQARAHELPAVIVTFDRHPAAILDPLHKPASLGTLEQNVIAMRQLGAGVCVILPFNEDLRQTPAEHFLERILRVKLHASALVVGHDFAMGRDRVGTADWLAERIPTTILPPVEEAGVRISSSAIRSAIMQGEVAEAARFLGRPYALRGVVIGGQKLGRTLGYPTINLARSTDQAIPADGVYAGRAVTPQGEFRAAISIGMRPAVQGKHRTVEAFLLDYPGDSLYGQAVELSFVARLRDELPFASLDDLVAQMAKDVALTATLT